MDEDSMNLVKAIKHLELVIKGFLLIALMTISSFLMIYSLESGKILTAIYSLFMYFGFWYFAMKNAKELKKLKNRR